MAMSREELATSPEAEALDAISRLERLVADGDWEHTEELAARIRRMVDRVPVEHRRGILLAAKRGVERAHNEAQAARDDVADRLEVLRRGRDAARAYAADG
ncbi:MAG: hypothetical protein QNI96_08395 [Woeseiaceae bacterium]|nr:hypothetical protein [Woeseiaceae bacterium]